MHFERDQQPERNENETGDLGKLQPPKLDNDQEPRSDLPSFDTSTDDPALAAVRTRAASGDGDAIFEMANHYLTRSEVPGNIPEGTRWLTLGVDQGHGRCLAALAEIIETSSHKSLPMEAAIPYYEQAAEKGYFGAYYRLAKIYEREDCRLKSTEKALDCLTRAAAGGVPEALFELGLSLFNTTHGEFSPPLGLTALHKAAKAGYVPAYREIGTLYFKGVLVPQEPAESFRWLSEGAALGDPQSVYLLGALYLGSGGAEYLDLFHACSCLLEAAKRGYPTAGNTLASLYTSGQLTSDDPHIVERLQKLSTAMINAQEAGTPLQEIDDERSALLRQVNKDVGRAWTKMVDEGDRGDIDSLVKFAIHMNNPAGPQANKDMALGIIEHIASEKGQEFADRVLEISRRFG